jgi:hypothetical protein
VSLFGRYKKLDAVQSRSVRNLMQFVIFPNPFECLVPSIRWTSSASVLLSEMVRISPEPTDRQRRDLVTMRVHQDRRSDKVHHVWVYEHISRRPIDGRVYHGFVPI